MPWYACDDLRTTCGVSFFLLPLCGFWSSSSSCWALEARTLHTEQTHWLKVYTLFLLLFLKGDPALKACCILIKILSAFCLVNLRSFFRSKAQMLHLRTTF